MSYIDDSNLDEKEERLLNQAERQYRYENAPSPPEILNILPIHYYGNPPIKQSIVTESIPPYRTYMTNDRFKIDIRGQPNCFHISTNTYYRLLKLIKSRYGAYPSQNYLVCDSISIVALPNTVCSLYYQPGLRESNQPCEFQLIGSFVNDRYAREFHVPCPYSDSMHGTDPICLFPFYSNTKTGKIVSRIYSSDYQLPSINTTMPWIQKNPLGSFFIDGIFDHITFNCSFSMQLGKFPRTTARYDHTYKRTRYTVHGQKIKGFNKKNRIDYNTESQDYWEDPRDPDPLYSMQVN